MNKTQNQYIKSGSFTTCTKPVLNYEKYMDVIEITIIPGFLIRFLTLAQFKL